MAKDILDVLRKALELAMPDLRHYYRMTRKARVVAVYPSDGSYYADVQPLRNDESPDPKEPIVPKVELPVMWGGPDRGVVCPPVVGVLCDLSYYDGDPNYPRISNIRWQGMNAPVAALNEFVIQLEKGVEIRVDKAKQIIALTPSNWIVQVGGNAEITASGNVTVNAGQHIEQTAPTIYQNGNVVAGGAGGSTGTVTENANRTQTGSLTLNGPLNVNGQVSISGTLSVGGGISGKVNGCSGC